MPIVERVIEGGVDLEIVQHHELQNRALMEVEMGLENNIHNNRDDNREEIQIINFLEKWQRKYKAEDNPNSPHCSICLEDFNIEEEIIDIYWNKENGHIFHQECIKKWTKMERKCPLWRKDLIELMKESLKNEIEENKKESTIDNSLGTIDVSSQTNEENKEEYSNLSPNESSHLYEEERRCSSL